MRLPATRSESNQLGGFVVDIASQYAPGVLVITGGIAQEENCLLTLSPPDHEVSNSNPRNLQSAELHWPEGLQQLGGEEKTNRTSSQPVFILHLSPPPPPPGPETSPASRSRMARGFGFGSARGWTHHVL